MRGLRHLIPDDVRDRLNANPTFQWIVTVLMVAVGAFFLFKGVQGVRNKSVTVRGGRVFEGTTAQVLGVVYALLGTLLAVIAVVITFGG